MNAVVLMLLRNGLKLAGTGALFSDSDVEQAAGAISLLAGLAWSGFNAWKEHKAAKPA
jgi:hypothetical protein